MIYELRRYEALPGKMAVLDELMAKLAVPIFERLGMRLVGAWQPSVGDWNNVLMYLLAFESMDERERKWQAFFDDAEWQQGRAEYAKRAGGPLVAREHHTFLKPTAYSPLK